MMGDRHEAAATIIQKRCRGIAARREARRKKLADEMKDKSTDDYDVNDLKRVIKLQALARAKKERGKQQRKVDAFFVIY